MLYNNIVHTYVVVGHTYFKIFVLGRFPPKREPKKEGLASPYCIASI